MATVTRTKHSIILYLCRQSIFKCIYCTSDGASYADAGSDACRADFLLFLFSERKALEISQFKPYYIISCVLLW
jgi:hypothetical protein